MHVRNRLSSVGPILDGEIGRGAPVPALDQGSYALRQEPDVGDLVRRQVLEAGPQRAGTHEHVSGHDGLQVYHGKGQRGVREDLVSSDGERAKDLGDERAGATRARRVRACRGLGTDIDGGRRELT